MSEYLQHLICPFLILTVPLTPAHIVAFICPYVLLSLKLINAVVLLILLTALSDPEQYHLTSAELANDLDVMDDASK